MIAKAMSRASKKIAEKAVLARGFSADFLLIGRTPACSGMFRIPEPERQT